MSKNEQVLNNFPFHYALMGTDLKKLSIKSDNGLDIDMLFPCLGPLSFNDFATLVYSHFRSGPIRTKQFSKFSS